MSGHTVCTGRVLKRQQRKVGRELDRPGQNQMRQGKIKRFSRV